MSSSGIPLRAPGATADAPHPGSCLLNESSGTTTASAAFVPFPAPVSLGALVGLGATEPGATRVQLQRPARLPRALTLFDFDWDGLGFARHAAEVSFLRAGFDLFSFPDNARLAWFDMDRFVDRQVARARREGVDALVSNNEQFGALAAALVAERLGLPGTPSKAVVACQHKLHFRKVMARVAPQANVTFAPLPCEFGDTLKVELDYPLFVKPVKAAFSVLARRIDSAAEMAAHIRFSPAEEWVIRRLVKPFNAVASRLLPGEIDANHMLIEEPVHAPQYNLDGYVWRGQVRTLGVVDELMYPGTQAFLRFRYPSQLAPAVQQRAADVASRFLEAVGFDHGFFNMEFFHDPLTDRLSIVEFNPRLSGQMADLYERVDGLDVFGMNLALAFGRDPAQLARRPASGGVAASCVFRTFDSRPPPAQPDAARRKALARQMPDVLLMTFPKSSVGFKRELKWLGSHRYGVMNLSAPDESSLRERHRQAATLLGWPAPW
ncbi:MAG: acetyl-CoA carboxylase biotin carboxylase subunit family protein [Lautropia sp.]